MIVVTGATGFIGGELVRTLAARGMSVRCFVRKSADLRSLRGIENSSYCYGDVTDPHSLQGAFDGAEAVIHCAGMLGKAGVPESDYVQLHVEGTRNVLNELLLTNNPPRLLYVSSPGVLGVIARGQSAHEGFPLAPTNPYERSKAVAEQLVMSYRDRLPIVVGRPEFVYGPTDLHVLGLFKAVQRGLFFYVDGGKSLCHPTYIDDAVNGLLLALERGKAGEIYHIVGEKGVTFRELGETIAKHLNTYRPFTSLPKPLAMMGATLLEQFLKNPPLSRTGIAFFSEDRHFSWQKAHQQLGYTPHYSLDHGIQETVAGYRARQLLR